MRAISRSRLLPPAAMLHVALLRFRSALLRKLLQLRSGPDTIRAVKRLWSVILTVAALRLGVTPEPSLPRSRPQHILDASEDSSALPQEEGSYDNNLPSSTPAILPQESNCPASSPSSRPNKDAPDVFNDKDMTAESPHSNPRDISLQPTSNDARDTARSQAGLPGNGSSSSRSIIPVRPYNIELNREDVQKYVPTLSQVLLAQDSC